MKRLRGHFDLSRGWGSLFFHLVSLMTRGQKRAVLFAVDLVAINLSLAVALALTFNRIAIGGDAMAAWPLFLALTVFGGVVTWLLGLPKIKLNAYHWSAILRTAGLAATMVVAGLAFDRLSPNPVPASLFYTFALIFFAVSVLGRIAMLHILLWICRRGVAQRRVLIYGAGATGIQLAAALSTHDTIEPVAFVDDNPGLRGMTVAGLPVHGPRDLPALVAAKRIDRVLLAIPRLPRGKMSIIVSRLARLGVDVHSVPSFARLAGEPGAEILERIEPVSAEGLLGRAVLADELQVAAETYAGKSILVTGAGGSIGSELCRQLVDLEPARIVLFDISEPSLYTIDREIRDLAGDGRTEVIARLGSVEDSRTVRRIIADYGISTVIHAAAYKHVPMVEANALVGLRNNVLGTRVLAEAARDLKVQNFLLVSTDKAVRPKSIMGASKRMAELIVQDLATRSASTRFSMVRFGNVLGSSGSVIPLFEEQIAKGGPVTVTHDDVTRYFMTIPEAARLVLTAAGFARGGDVFLLDMGEPRSIRRIAREMIEASGLTVRDETNPEGDIEIRITGLRKGEKLHEELVIGPDRVTTPHPKILRAQDGALSEFEVANMLRDLGAAIDAGDEAAARRTILRFIPHNAFEESEPGAAPVKAGN